MAKKLREIVEAIKDYQGRKETKQESMSAFVGDHVENTKITHDALRKKFIKTYGQEAHDKHFEKLVSKHVD